MRPDCLLLAWSNFLVDKYRNIEVAVSKNANAMY